MLAMPAPNSPTLPGEVTDVGLAFLLDLVKLRVLDVTGCGVTAEGVAEFHTAAELQGRSVTIHSSV